MVRNIELIKDQDITLQAGDLIEVSTPGGGGYGNPQARTIEAIEEDLAHGYYAPPDAAAQFCAVIDSFGRVDRAATEALRSKGYFTQPLITEL